MFKTFPTVLGGFQKNSNIIIKLLVEVLERKNISNLRLLEESSYNLPRRAQTILA